MSARMNSSSGGGPRKARVRRVLAAVAAGVAAVATAVSVGAGSAAARTWDADTVLRNGFVYTVDSHDRVAHALAVRDGKIVYVGSNGGVRRFVGRGTEVVDLGGRMVMPGLHEGHIHDVTAPNPGYRSCDLQAAPLTVRQFQQRIRACLDDPRLGSEPDDFLLVDNFYMQFLKPYGTAPHKRMLDALDTERPIFVSAAVTGHTTLVNQNALDLAGIDRNTPDPDGGRINHDPNGEPNGLLEDAASDLVSRHIPPPPPLSRQERIELAGKRMQEFSREGITSFFVPGSTARRIDTFQGLRDADGLTARAHFAVWSSYDDLRDPASLYADVQRIRDEYERPEQLPVSVRSWRPGHQRGPKLVAEPGVSVDGVKIFLDGIVQYPGQTAAVLHPYLDAEGNPRTDENARGELYADGEVLNPVVTGLARRGFQSHIHAIGDRAVRTALDAFEAAHRAEPRIRSHPTIAHAELVDPADYRRFGRLDATASMGLQWAKPAPDSFIGTKPYLGERFDLYEPTVPITRHGGRVSLGSDCCLEPFDEWFALEVATLREGDWGGKYPEFSGTVNALPGLPLRETIRAATINGAYQMHQERVTGSLERGKLADLIVLDQNITKVAPDDISETDVLLTMVGGDTVWRDPSF